MAEYNYSINFAHVAPLTTASTSATSSKCLAAIENYTTSSIIRIYKVYFVNNQFTAATGSLIALYLSRWTNGGIYAHPMQGNSTYLFPVRLSKNVENTYLPNSKIICSSGGLATGTESRFKSVVYDTTGSAARASTTNEIRAIGGQINLVEDIHPSVVASTIIQPITIRSGEFFAVTCANVATIATSRALDITIDFTYEP